MLSRLLRREKPRVFLGTLAVVPRTDLKRHLEQEGIIENESLDEALRRNLIEIFSLPLAQHVDAPLKSDLVLDVLIARFQSGEILDVGLGDAELTIFWRPKITVASRLYSLQTRKTKATFSVTEKMKWMQFMGRLFTWRGLFRSQPFVRADMEYLLCQACVKLLARMQKAL
ncbi:hypothetical protein [Steroidobacter cummioxidans]|uniref:hypothetical protein n=1 Tax=Steroidobacter cummioxidans TaxID=1803913 RepID=UPI00129019DC|nr:hypothetical protein [Steroidobacter cummioxidans]